MKNKTLTVLGALAISIGASAASTEMDSFIDSLMSRMTLDEKLGQLNLPAAGDFATGEPLNARIGDLAANARIGGTFNIAGTAKIRSLQQIAVEETRLGIPLLIGLDVIHGCKTIFPIPLALSASWDTVAVERMAHVSAVEASALGIGWTFSPMVDISRDPRWGRVAEGAGEDPYLGSLIARAYVRGYQGDLSKPDNILACVKHFALYGASEAGRDYNTVDMGRQRMYNEYLAPYQAAVDADVATLMTSFNLVDGIPATANKWLVSDLLRKQWGYEGMVVTDYESIKEMRTHGVGDMQANAVRAIKAGTDMDMCAGAFADPLLKAYKEGKVGIDVIDRACRRVLEAKYRSGLFENPYKYNDLSREKKDVLTPAHL